MTKIDKIFRAGFVRRWHQNPDLCHTADPVDGHSGRVARLILALHPNPSMGLLRAALVHDDGEHATGDMSGPAKRANPQMSEMLDRMERAARIDLWGSDFELWQEEHVWLKFADRLDAYMWAKHHAPHITDSDDWPECRRWLFATAEDLGVSVTL